MGSSRLAELEAEVVDCRRCPRLVAWREEVAAAPRASFAQERYWGRPLPGFGDPAARLVLVGLAPAAHGGNRTGRMFTGDRSGDFLYAALHRAGFASAGLSTGRDDGLELSGAWVTAAVRCAPPANRPTPGERASCSAFLERELTLLEDARVLLALGGFALDALWRVLATGRAGVVAPTGPAPRLAHGLEMDLGSGRTLVCSYHPSQRNTFTGLLTPTMLDAVLERARELALG